MTFLVTIALAVLFFSVVFPIIVFGWTLVTAPIFWLLGKLWEHKIMVSLLILAVYGITRLF